MGVTVIASAFDMGSGLTFGNETITIPVPVAAQTGDLAIFMIDIPSANPLTNGAVGSIQPSGMVDVAGSPITFDSGGLGSLAGRVLWKILDGTETQFVAVRTTTNTNGISGCLVILRGASSASPFNAVSSEIGNHGGTGYPITLPSITTTKQTGILMLHGVRGSVGAFDPTSPGFTELIDEIMFGSRHVKADFRADVPPGVYNSFVLDTNPGHPTSVAFTFVLAIQEGGLKNWELYDGDNMKTDFQSTETLKIRLRPFINKTNGEFITGGADTVTLFIEKPDNTMYEIEGGPYTASYDSNVDLWFLNIPLEDYVQGEWRLKAVSDDADAVEQWQVYTWGLGAAEDTAGIKKFALNRWKVVGTQLLLYEDDGEAVFKTYDLKDIDGVASNTKVFERVPFVAEEM